MVAAPVEICTPAIIKYSMLRAALTTFLSCQRSSACFLKFAYCIFITRICCRSEGDTASRIYTPLFTLPNTALKDTWICAIVPGDVYQNFSPKDTQGIVTAKWFCNCSLSLRPADCVVKPRRCAASPVFYALSTELMKTDHFTKPLRGDYNMNRLPVRNTSHTEVHQTIGR
jgi:hypothetical protein